MLEKIQRNLRMLAFAARTGAGLQDKLTLAGMLTKHIAVHRGWSAFTSEVKTVRCVFKGREFAVHLRDNGTDIIIFEDVFNKQCYELGAIAPRHIVDAGANIGLASLYFSLLHPQATLSSFEPVEHEMCARNASNVFDLALGSHEGVLNILIDPNNSGGHRLELYDSDPALQRKEVRLQRLDALIDAQRVPPPDMLKIDAEGAECDILQGLGKHAETLDHLTVEVQSAKNHQWIREWLASHGFTRIEERILHPEASHPGDAYSMIAAHR